MSDTNQGALKDVAKALEKQPNTIKEVVKVLTELVVKLDAFTTELKKDVAKADEETSSAEIRTELGGIRTSIGFINDGFEESKKDIERYRGELVEVKAEAAQCRKTNEQLKRELDQAKKEIIGLKQYSRNMNLEIQGLPVAADEDLGKTVEDIAKCLGTSVTEGDIDIVHRMPSKDKDKPNVLVKFVSRTAREKLLLAARKKTLKADKLGFDTTDLVYINEHLCIENKILLSKARKLKKEKNWKYVWVSQGKILMRKSESSSILHVTCEADLANVA